MVHCEEYTWSICSARRGRSAGSGVPSLIVLFLSDGLLYIPFAPIESIAYPLRGRLDSIPILSELLWAQPVCSFFRSSRAPSIRFPLSGFTCLCRRHWWGKRCQTLLDTKDSPGVLWVKGCRSPSHLSRSFRCRLKHALSLSYSDGIRMTVRKSSIHF